MKVPGIGTLTAVQLRITIGDINRFDAQKIGCLLRLGSKESDNRAPRKNGADNQTGKQKDTIVACAEG